MNVVPPHLIKALLHQLATVTALYQRALRGCGYSTKAEEALLAAVTQEPKQGIGLRWLHRLEAGEGCDVAWLGAKAHQLLAVLIMNQLLLCDLIHLFSHSLKRRGRVLDHVRARESK